jgi:hypothetical protein
MTRFRLTLFAAVLAGTFTVAAQTPEPPPTGVVLGKVVDATNNQPLKGVSVTLVPEPVYPQAPGSPTPQSTLTDPQGRFVFRHVPRGRYDLNATIGASGYSPNGLFWSGSGSLTAAHLNASYGQRRAEGPAEKLVLGDAARMGDVVIRMWKSGSIDGAVLDEAGEPLVGMVVIAARRSTTGVLVGGPSTTTDDRGLYHFGTLAPGQYVIVVPQTQVLMPDSTLAAFAANPDARGRIGSQITSNGGPQYTGESVTRGRATIVPTGFGFPMSNGLAPSGSADPAFAYQTTFFPASTSLSSARPISVASGARHTGIDVRLNPIRTTEVSGVMTDASGPVPHFAVHLLPAGDDGRALFGVASTVTDGSGRFTFPQVPPGQFTLAAVRAGNSPPARAGGPPPPTPSRVAEASNAWASHPLTVGGDPVRDVALMLRAPVHVRGRIEFQGSSFELVPPRVRQAAVAAIRVPPLIRGRADGGSRVIMSNDGAFDLVVAPGRYRIGLAPGFPTQFFGPWSLEAVSIAGLDIGDAIIDVGTTDLSEVVMRFTERPAQISGTVQAGGRPDADPAVFMFPKDSTRWPDGRDSITAFRTVRVQNNGAFVIPNVMPGEYYVAAAPESASGDWPDVPFLQQLAAVASSVQVSAGQTQTVALRPAVAR